MYVQSVFQIVSSLLFLSSLLCFFTQSSFTSFLLRYAKFTKNKVFTLLFNYYYTYNNKIVKYLLANCLYILYIYFISSLRCTTASAYLERKQYGYITENPGLISHAHKKTERNRRLSAGEPRGCMLCYACPAEPSDVVLGTYTAALL